MPDTKIAGKFTVTAAPLPGVLVIEPGDIFFSDEVPPLNHFRLGFSSIARERIDAGIRELALVLRELAPR